MAVVASKQSVPPQPSAPASLPLPTCIMHLQQSQADSLARIFNSVMANQSSATPSQPPAASDASSARGNFSACTARFGGGNDDVDAFIDAIQAYKECVQISDANALRGFSLLLTNEAATWWQGIKPYVNSWNDALASFVSAFGDRRPPHRIYREIFSMEQGDSERTDIFISRVRALLARLPKGDLTEKVKLDMLYGLLNRRIRQRMRREDIASFADLLEVARSLEDADVEGKSSQRTSAAGRGRAVNAQPPPPPRRPAQPLHQPA